MVHGGLRHFCKVHKDFKVIILQNQEESDFGGRDDDIEIRQPSPFLNRFEKHVILTKDVVHNVDIEVMGQIDKKIDSYFTDF